MNREQRERDMDGSAGFTLPTYAHYDDESEGGQMNCGVCVCLVCWSEHTGADTFT